MKSASPARRAIRPALAVVPRAAQGTDLIYERLKGMAMTFAIRPGERVNEVELARALNVSRTPLREALNRLMVDGFLTRSPNKGFSGRTLDAQQVYDLYEMRMALETGAARIACERASDDELLELERFVRASKDRPEDASAASLLALDEQFHERIALLTRNQEMVRTLRAINARVHYVRWIDMRAGRRRHTQQEHLRIVKALRDRDAARASQLVETHISLRLDQIVEMIQAGFAEIYMRDRAAPAAVAG